MIGAQDKAQAIALIQEACKVGCRAQEACEVLGIDIRTLQRWKKEESHADKRQGPNSAPANKLSAIERARILEVANSEEFCNQLPSQIVPTLADQSVYIGSESSFYRILKQENQLTHRGGSRQRTHKKPAELVALKPNQVWSWDISYLPGPIRGKFFYLYFFLDIFSRKIVGFDVFEQESAEYAAEVVSRAYVAENIRAGEVSLHSDNGGPMKGSTMLLTLQNLGIMPSFSRPSVSNDNPFSESNFKTVKYCPFYPKKPFASLEEAYAWVVKFVLWYNHVHQHSGINFVTPNIRHKGLDSIFLEKRSRLYEIARQKNPNRWSKKIRNWSVAGEVFLNPKHSKKEAAKK